MSSTPTKPIRPLSPHLQVYRPQLTSMLSILHRATGIALSVGLILLVAWLVTIAANEEIYSTLTRWLAHPVGQVVLFGLSWAFFYHFCTGIRHLLWDSGYFLDIRNVYRTGWLAVLISALTTAYVWGQVIGNWNSTAILFGELIGAVIVLGILAGIALMITGMLPSHAKNRISMRTPLAKARGLGSAKEGTHHWWLQRFTSVVLIPLSIYVIVVFFTDMAYSSHEDAIRWISSPFVAVALILLLAVGFHHAASGLQVVIEDYVHCEGLKLTSIIAVKFVAAALALFGSIAVIKILFFAIVAMMTSHAPTHQ